MQNNSTSNQDLKQSNNKKINTNINPHKKQRISLVEGSIWKHLLRIASPAMFAYMFNSLYNWVDAFWGGKISTDVLAAFSITFPFVLITIALGQMFATGGLVLASNALGAKNPEDAQYYMVQSVLCELFASIVLIIIVHIFGDTILSLLGAKGSILKYSHQYLKVLSYGFPLMMIFFALNISFTSHGNTKFMRNINILNVFINLGLDPLLMYGLKISGTTIIPTMGIEGLALATVFVQALAVILAWYKIQKDPDTRWHIKTRIIPHTQAFVQIFSLGLPTLIQIGMASIGISAINFFLAKLSTGTTVAAYGIGLRIEQMALIPTIGISIAMTALVGQNNGAKLYFRVRESFAKAIALSALLWLLVMIPLSIFGDIIASIFTHNVETIAIAKRYLYFSFVNYMSFVIIGLSTGLLQGIKKPRFTTIINILRQAFPIALIPILTKLWGIYGVFASFTIIFWLSALFSFGLAMYNINKKISLTL